MTSETKQDYHERLLRVLVHIQTHLDETLPLDDLARIAHFSAYHFHRIFRGMVGEGVKEHVRRLRMERAAHRLKHTDEPVTRIAFEAGYEAHEAFTRAFRSMFDQSPSEFRQTHRPLPLEDVPSGVHFSINGKVESFTPAQTGDPPMEVRVEQVAPMNLAFVRHVGPYNEVGSAWQKLMAWAGPNGMLGPNMKLLGIVHDDPEVTPPERIRYDACLLVNPAFEGQGEIGAQEIAGGEYAVARHTGPYEKLGDTYAGLCGQWLPGSGRKLRAAPGFEVYLNSPQDTAPLDLMTDIHLALEQK